MPLSQSAEPVIDIVRYKGLYAIMSIYLRKRALRYLRQQDRPRLDDGPDFAGKAPEA